MSENDTLWGGTYLYGLYMGVNPPPGGFHSPSVSPRAQNFTKRKQWALSFFYGTSGTMVRLTLCEKQRFFADRTATSTQVHLSAILFLFEVSFPGLSWPDGQYQYLVLKEKFKVPTTQSRVSADTRMAFQPVATPMVVSIEMPGR